MKILYVVTKAVVGGAQTSVLNLAREMKRRGHEVFVGFGDGDWLPVELGKSGISYFRFDFLKRTHNPFSLLLFVSEIRKYVREHDFDVVHFNSSNTLPGALGVKLSGKKIKTVFTFRGMSMLDEHYEASPLLKFLYKIFFKIFLLFIDTPVFISQENFNKFGRGQLVSRGELIYNGLDNERVEFLPKTEARDFFLEKSGIADKEFFNGKYIVGALGRLDYAKNYEFLINIFSKMLEIRQDAVAVIIGDGSKRSECEEAINKKGLGEKIFLLGNIDNGNRYLKGFDLLVLPSRYEGLSITLIEALLAGLPILASDVGGNSEVVGNVDQIYRFNDEYDFLKKFKFLQDNSILMKALLDNSTKKKNFYLKNTADGYEKVYSSH
jgi:glycosyltransferase involved in cell wall biosynthesis